MLVCFFFCDLEAISTKSFQFFPFGILEIIHFKLALFATTKERAFNTRDQIALPELTQMCPSVLLGEKKKLYSVMLQMHLESAQKSFSK